jgi:hypothetical protein
MSRRVSVVMLAVVMIAAAVAAVHCTPAATLSASDRFPHRAHLVKTNIDCYTCHQNIRTSDAISGFVSPGYAPCKKCHGEDVGPQTKFAFDPARTYSGTPSPRHVVFSHKQHRDVTAGQCTRCHQDVQKDEVTPRILPDMATCMGTCHSADYAEANCTICHRARDLTRLRPETDMAHGVDYVPRHQTDAVRARSQCMACHEEQHCSSCHDTSAGLRAEVRRLDDVHGTYRHEGDFVTRHAIEARTDSRSCVRCHEPSSCDSCHVQNRVSGNRLGASTPHPAGWVGSNPDHADFHGRAARRRIVECSSCHEQGPATNCIRCHKVGAFGGNPHPSGWRSGRSKANTEICAYCHTN